MMTTGNDDSDLGGRARRPVASESDSDASSSESEGESTQRETTAGGRFGAARGGARAERAEDDGEGEDGFARGAVMSGGVAVSAAAEASSSSYETDSEYHTDKRGRR